MAEKSTVCTICDERHIYRQSTDWCFECEQALCAECKEFHTISKSSRNHATIPIKDYQILGQSVAAVSGYCSDHEEKCQMLCQTHDKILCPQCIQKHFECRDVLPLSTITKNVKTSEAFREAKQCLIDIDQNILKIEDTVKEKIRNLNKQREIILSDIIKVRQKLNEHLDQIENAIKKDILAIEHTASQELETVLKVLKEKKEKNSSSEQRLGYVIKHATDLQAFFALRQISSEITTTETFLQSIIDDGHIDKIALEFIVDENCRSIPDKINTFGYVRAQKSPSDLTLVKQKVKQAQLVGVNATSIQDIKLKLTQTITTDIGCTRGCDILPDGKLFFCDHSSTNRLVVTDTDGKHLFQVPAKQNAFDLICISDTTVAVTTGSGLSYGINIIDISSRKTLKFIAKDYRCYGITSVNGSLVYCVLGKGVEMMDADGKNTTTIVRCDLPDFTYIASYNDKLYYTNHLINTVTCCDMTGNTIWTFKDKTVLLCPFGISVDNDGHVYVVSHGNNSVVVLSADGQQSRQILSEEDGLNYPTAIHYDRNRKQLLVTNFRSTAFLFELSTLH